jgi:hypothetical protein
MQGPLLSKAPVVDSPAGNGSGSDEKIPLLAGSATLLLGQLPPGL